MKKNFDFDEVAKKIEEYGRKHHIQLRASNDYNEEETRFIDYTMSCDKLEIIETAKVILKTMIQNGTTSENRNQMYSEYLAVYDIYQSIYDSI